jgi:hypothetical protein
LCFAQKMNINQKNEFYQSFILIIIHPLHSIKFPQFSIIAFNHLLFNLLIQNKYPKLNSTIITTEISYSLPIHQTSYLVMSRSGVQFPASAFVLSRRKRKPHDTDRDSTFLSVIAYLNARFLYLMKMIGNTVINLFGMMLKDRKITGNKGKEEDMSRYDADCYNRL